MRASVTAMILMAALVVSASAQSPDQRQTSTEHAGQAALPKPSPAERIRCGLPHRILNREARSACASIGRHAARG
jgi:hypothetical protein